MPTQIIEDEVMTLDQADPLIQLEEKLQSKLVEIARARGKRAELYRLIDAELVSARKKFPKATKMFAVIQEEVGELAQAMLTYDSGECKHRYGIEFQTAHGNVVKEGVQAIAMIIRLLEEGDPAHVWYPPDWLADRGADPQPIPSPSMSIAP